MHASYSDTDVLRAPAGLGTTQESSELQHRVGENNRQLFERLLGDAVLIAIAECESTMRHYEKDGTVLKSYLGTADYGLLQINRVHFPTAEDMGIDVMTVEGNVAYGKYLYEKQGTRPWKSSETCWKSKIQ